MKHLYKLIYLLLSVIALSTICFNSYAQSTAYADAQDSDPKALGWMQGFPPPPDKLIMQPESDFFSFPKLRWTVCHIRELMPTKRVRKGLKPPSPLEYSIDSNIDSVTFNVMGTEKTMTWKESLGANYTDGLLILHKGRVVYEYYSGCLDEGRKHAAMSMTKSLTGLLAETLVVEGNMEKPLVTELLIPTLLVGQFGYTDLTVEGDCGTCHQEYKQQHHRQPEIELTQSSHAAINAGDDRSRSNDGDNGDDYPLGRGSHADA